MLHAQTLAAQLAKAVAVIVINTDKNLIRVPAPPELDTKVIRIPTVMVPPSFMDIMPKYWQDAPPLVRLVMYEKA